MSWSDAVKQRIVGAVVLISLAAIIIPVVMDFHKDKAVREKAVGIPPKPKDFSVQVLPLVHPDKAPPPAAAVAPPAVATGQAVAAPPQPAAAPAPSAASASDAPVARKDSPEAWDVQVGSFSSRDRAVALRDKLRARHFDAYVEKTVLDSGYDSYRVRVGPVLRRAEAEKLQGRLKSEEHLPAIVINH